MILPYEVSLRLIGTKIKYVRRTDLFNTGKTPSESILPRV
jgi:hypothetical protein